MNKIIKILGPSGAGKTTVVRDLMDACDIVVPIKMCGATKIKTIGYELMAPEGGHIYVPGSYGSNCGGVDTIDSAQKVMDDIDEWESQGHVVYEGLLQSTYYGAMGKWSKKFGDRFIYAWLNTPLDVCMERLHARRAQNGTKRPLNVQQAEDKWATVKRAFERAIDEGHDCREIRWNERTTPQILDMLK